MKLFLVAICIAICAPLIANSQNVNTKPKKFPSDLYKKFQPPKAEIQQDEEKTKLKNPSQTFEHKVFNKPETVIDKPKITSSSIDSSSEEDDSLYLDGFLPFDSIYPDVNDGTLDKNGNEDQDKVVDVFHDALPTDFQYHFEQFPLTFQSESESESEFESDSSFEESQPDNIKYEIAKEKPITDHSKVDDKPIKTPIKTTEPELPKTPEEIPHKEPTKFEYVPDTSSYDSSESSTSDTFAEWKDVHDEKGLPHIENSKEDIPESDFAVEEIGGLKNKGVQNPSFEGDTLVPSDYSELDYSDIEVLMPETEKSDFHDTDGEGFLTTERPPFETDDLPYFDDYEDYGVTEPMTPPNPTTESPLNAHHETVYDKAETVPFVESSEESVVSDEEPVIKPPTSTTPHAKSDAQIDFIKSLDNVEIDSAYEYQTEPMTNADEQNDIESNEIPHNDQPNNVMRFSLATFLRSLFGSIPLI